MHIKNKLSVSLLALQNFNDLESFLKVLKKNNIRYVELPIAKILPKYKINKKKINNFLRILNKYKIKVSSTQAVFYKKKINVLKKSDLKKNLNHFKKIIKITKFFGAKNIIFGSPNNRKKNNLSLKKSYENFEALLKKINSSLIKEKIFLLIEPNSKFYKCDFINNIQEALSFIKYLNLKNIFINLDTGNAIIEKDELNISQQNFKYIKNIQISEKNLKEISKRINKHIKILKKVNSKKICFSLEMLNINLNRLDINIMKFKKIVQNVRY